MTRAIPKVCGCCDQIFFAGHNASRYCSLNCKQTAYYRRRKVRDQVQLAAVVPQVVQPEILDDPDELPPAWREAAAEAQGLECRTWNGTAIQRRESDGYVNATAMCKANGKHLPHYLANKGTGEYLQALSTSVGIPTDLLVQSVVTGPNELRGTWVHLRVAVYLARLIDPPFAVWMDGWFLESLSLPAPRREPQLPQLPPSGPAILIRANTYREAAQVWADALEAAAAGAIRRRYSTHHRGPDTLSLPSCAYWQHLPA